MKAERRQAWVDALRSGKYKQTQGKLHNSDDSFCCLGVLCDITDPTQWRVFGGAYLYSPGSSSLYLPENLRMEIGGSDIEQILMEANDGKIRYERNPQYFEQIADLIEKIVPLTEE